MEFLFFLGLILIGICAYFVFKRHSSGQEVAISEPVDSEESVVLDSSPAENIRSGVVDFDLDKDMYALNLKASMSNMSDESLKSVELVIDDLIWINKNKDLKKLGNEKNYRFKKISCEDFPEMVMTFINLDELSKAQKEEFFIDKVRLVGTFCKSFKDAINSGKVEDFEVSEKFIGIRL